MHIDKYDFTSAFTFENNRFEYVIIIMKEGLKMKTLLILAAGMGSRFGGLKQIEPVGPNGEFIIDYSVYDAIKVGFERVIFIIKEENLEIFKSTIGKRLEDKIKVEYVFQKLSDMPGNYQIPDERVKPWGTGHAMYAARNNIDAPFATITSDDFYGLESFAKLAEYLNSNPEAGDFVTIGFKIKNTLSEYGSVKRGLFETNGDEVVSFIESVVEPAQGKLVATPINQGESFEIANDHLASMVMFGFTPKLFRLLEDSLISFQERNKANLETCEYLLPDEMKKFIEDGECVMKIKKTDAIWHGVTYKEDLDKVKQDILKYIEAGIYPADLWSEK